MNPETPKPSQRALTAAKSTREFSSEARDRQLAGTRVAAGTKGKATARAAERFGVSPRAVEQALTVLRRGIPELAQAVENDLVAVSVAAKVATRPAEAQRHFIQDVAGGRPAAEALIVAGVMEREPPQFDDKTLSRALASVLKMIDLRTRAYGPHEAERDARSHLDLASRAVSRWRTERHNEPVPVMTDARSRQVPV